MKLENLKIPNLFIVGASKCATTYVWDVLRQHPQVFMGETKEPSYFARRDMDSRLLWYLSLFERAGDAKVIGEASPIYSETTVFPDVASKIYRFNGDAKVIYLVRNPVDRMISVWRQTLSSGHWYEDKYKLNFGKDVQLMPLDFERAIFDYPAFLEASRYWVHLNKYLEFFPEQKILLLFYEDLKSDSKAFFQQVFQFLDIDPAVSVEDTPVRKNQGVEKRMLRNSFVQFDPGHQRLLKKTLPPFLFKKIQKKKIKINRLLSNSLRQQIEAELQVDMAKILEYGNKEPDYWQLRK